MLLESNKQVSNSARQSVLQKKIKGRLMFAALIGPNITMSSGPIGYY